MTERKRDLLYFLAILLVFAFAFWVQGMFIGAP